MAYKASIFDMPDLPENIHNTEQLNDIAQYAPIIDWFKNSVGHQSVIPA